MRNTKASQFFKKHFGTMLFFVTIAVAAFLRFYQLQELPPALHPSEAVWVFQARQLVSGPGAFLAQLSAASGAFLLSIGTFASSLVVHDSLVALRALNAALGVVAVIGLYWWAKDCFGRRPALLSALVFAVSPWAITLSRNILPLNVSIALFVWLCFFATRAYRKGSFGYGAVSIVILVLGMMSSRLFWLVPVTFVVPLAYVLLKPQADGRKKRYILLSVFAALVVIAGLGALIVAFGNPAQGMLSALSQNLANLQAGALFVLNGIGRTLAMFFVTGDDNYFVNLGGLPLLNTFFGLMLLLGAMVAIKYRARLVYTFVLISFAIMLVPAIVSPRAPDAYWAALALPLCCLLVGIGINYLLTRWYSMFPVNTTARSLGLSFVILLLVLSGYQAYRQYFVAWAQDPSTRLAYREDILEASRLLNQKDVVVVTSQQDQVALLAYRRSSEASVVNVSGLESLAVNNKPKVVVVLNSDNAEKIKQRVTAKYPGGSFSTQQSSFDGRSLLYLYRLP